MYVLDIATRSFTRLTFNPEYDGYPLWLPDSKRLLFQSTVGGQRTIVRKAIDGTGPTETLFTAGTDLLNLSSITPDGAELIFRRIMATGGSELWALPLNRAADARALLAMEHDQQIDGEISPDGRWLAYQANESGRFEIYLRPYSDMDGGRWQVSPSGGVQPAWRHDGHALFYLTGNQLVEVDVSGGATPMIGAPRVALASIGYTPFDRSGRNYDVAPDGRRFLVRDAATADSATYDVVLSWTREPHYAQ
jgi:Tol biopolymer transport system component